MTIQDDDAADKRDVRRDAEMGARRFAAAISGAIEGFVTALDEHDLAATTRESIETAGEVARAGGSELKDIADAPEVKQVGQAVGRVADRAGDAMKAKAEDVRNAARDAKDTVAETIDDAKETVYRAKEDVKFKARAVAESGRRARVAPARIMRELRAAVGTWWGALVTAIAMGLAMGVFAIVTLVVLTIALVVGLNQVLGDPRGTWLTVAIYGVAMLISYGIMTTRRKAAKLETQRHLERSRAEAQHVVQPVRSAFGGKKGAY